MEKVAAAKAALQEAVLAYNKTVHEHWLAAHKTEHAKFVAKQAEQAAWAEYHAAVAEAAAA